MSASFYRLTRIHARLDAQICGELSRRFPDGFRLMRLKKLRLAVKDKLRRQFMRPQST